MTKEDYDRITNAIIGCAIEVHRELGPGLLESVYEECLFYELRQKGIRVERQKRFNVPYKDQLLNKGFVIDLLVEDRVIVELKSVDYVLPVHEVQLVTYLKLASKKLGLLINFNVPLLTEGVKRKINGTL